MRWAVGLDSDLSQFYLEIVQSRFPVVRFLSVHRKSQVTVAESYPHMEYNKYFAWDCMLYVLARGNKMSVTTILTGSKSAQIILVKQSAWIPRYNAYFAETY